MVRLPSSNGERVAAALMRWFATWGAPERLQTDGGPPFNASGFASMCKMFHIRHVMSSPYNARSNGHAESAGVREAKRLVHKFESAEYFKALLARRNAGLPSRGGCAPAKLVLGRLLRGGDLPLPDREQVQTELQRVAAEKLASDREKAVERQKSLRGADAPSFAAGDLVWVQSPATGKWIEDTVESRKASGRSYFVRADDVRVWRNVRFLKPREASGFPEEAPTSPPAVKTVAAEWQAVARPAANAEVAVSNRFEVLGRLPDG